MKRSEEIIFAVKTISPKEDDIVIIKSGNNLGAIALVELEDFLDSIKCKAIFIKQNDTIEDMCTASEEELKKIGLMRIPKETNGS